MLLNDTLSNVWIPLKSAWVIMEHLRFGWMKVPWGKGQKWQFLWFGGFGPLWTCRNWQFSLCMILDLCLSTWKQIKVLFGGSLERIVTGNSIRKYHNIYFIWRLFCFWKVEERKELTDVTLADQEHKSTNLANKEHGVSKPLTEARFDRRAIFWNSTGIQGDNFT